MTTSVLSIAISGIMLVQIVAIISYHGTTDDDA